MSFPGEADISACLSREITGAANKIDYGSVPAIIAMHWLVMLLVTPVFDTCVFLLWEKKKKKDLFTF